MAGKPKPLPFVGKAGGWLFAELILDWLWEVTLEIASKGLARKRS